MAGRTLSICVLGGTGFVGTELVSRLATAGHWVRVPTRSLSRGNHLRVLPTVELRVANVHDGRVLSQLLTGMDVVVNLIGILNTRGLSGREFRTVHVDLAAKLIEAARTTQVRRLLQMSALGASRERGPSQYLRTKGEAEELIRAATSIEATVFRPSVIFGSGDSLTRRFARLLRLSGGFLPLARPGARFAPIHVDDVAQAFARALTDRSTIGQAYELCGPEIVTLAELVRTTARIAGLPCHIIPLPDAISRVQAALMNFVPGKPFSTDNYKSLTIDAICRENGCERLGIRPAPMAAVLPAYLRA